MAKRRSTEGKKGKHGRDESEYTEGLAAQRRRNKFIIMMVVVVVIAVVLLVVSYFFFLAPEEEEEDKPVLSAAQLSVGGYPTNPIGFNFTINNPENKEDIYSILITHPPPGWIVDLPITISVDKKESVKTNFTVTPLLETALNQTYHFTLTITSGNTQQSYSLDYNLIIFLTTYDFELLCLNNTHDADPGNSTAYAILIRNDQNGEDTIYLSYTESHLPANWSVNFDFDSITIDARNYQVVICTVNTSENSSKGRYDIKLIATTSLGATAELWVNTSLILDFAEDKVEEEDKVQIDYIGVFTNAFMFDTSLFEAANNTDFPKTADFQPKPNSSYTPLGVYIGPSDPDPGDDYTQVIQGFWEGAIGMKVNETTVVRIPAEKAYNTPGHALYGRPLIFQIKLISIDG
jgi:hypothetical protein